jgi:predicted RNA-binding Zn ribbon-like protein
VVIQQHSQAELAEARALQICLEFANTLKWHASAQPAEQLTSYAALVDWACQMGAIDAAVAQRLRTAAGQRPAAAAATLEQAIDLREAIYRLFAALAHGRAPAASDLAQLNVALAGALAHARIDSLDGEFVWGWSDDGSLDCMLWPLARAAGELLTSSWRARVGQCADDRGCGWLFIDTSKNHSRRWCDINDCGNRAKARRHYQRMRTR